MAVVLPPEILGHIVSFPDPIVDQPVLRNLSLSNTTLRHLSQERLFLHIHLLYSKESTKTQPGERLFSLLTRSPHLAFYIKRITIKNPDHQWSPDPHLLPAIQQINLHQIEAVELGSGPHHVHGLFTPWATLSRDMQRAMIALCRSPSLTHLTVYRLPYALVSACSPSIKDLNVRCLWSDRGSQISLRPRPRPLALRSLELYGVETLSPTVNDIIQAMNIDLSSLEHLVVRADGTRDYAATQKLFEQCSSTLRSFHFSPGLGHLGKSRSPNAFSIH